MTRPEAAEPTMDEILASIRKIIAEEPVGSRPLPGGPARVSRPEAVARPAPAAASPMTTPAPAASDPFGLPRSAPQAPAAAPNRDAGLPRAAVDPVAEAMAGAVAPRPQAPVAPQAGANLPPADDKLFGRLAEALRGGPAASPSPAPTPFGKPAVSDDLADLLDEPAAKAEAGPAPSAADADLSQDKTINRRAVDFGAIVPQRSQAVGAEPVAVAPASPDAAPRSAKPSAHAEAFDKMLTARMTPAKAAEPPAASPPSEGPVVIAAMPERKSTADTGEKASSSVESTAVDDPDTAASDEAKSALGALMAGLAAAAPVSEPAAAGQAATAAGPVIDKAQKPVEPETPTPAAAATVKSEATASAPFATPKFNGAALHDAASKAIDTPPQPSKTEARVTISPARIVRESAAGEAPQKPAAPPTARVVATTKPADLVTPPPAAPKDKADAAGVSAPAPATGTQAEPAAATPPAGPSPTPAQLPAMAALQLQGIGGTPVLGASVSPQGVRTVEDIVAELLRPMLREWLAENMPRMVEKALRIELADSLKSVGPAGAAALGKPPEKGGSV